MHCPEFEKERLGKIKSLDECAVEDRLHDDEEQWKEMCDTRFGLSVSGQVLHTEVSIKLTAYVFNDFIIYNSTILL